MDTSLYIDTPGVVLFGLLFTIGFGYWLRRRVTSTDYRNRSTFYFLMDNYELVGGFLIGIGLLVFGLIGFLTQ